MKNPKKFLEDKEGVSPVIGVILMVAITVIMAAIVAGFVFGVISTPQPTPQASIGIDEARTDHITLLHQSGDKLNQNETRVVVAGTFTGLNASDSNQTIQQEITFQLSELTDSNWVSGTSIGIQNSTLGLTANDFNNINGTNYSGAIFTSGSTVTVRVVDEPSGGTVSSPSATVK